MLLAICICNCNSVLALTGNLGRFPTMANPNHPTNPAQPASSTEIDWSWLRSRLEGTAALKASHDLSDWMGQQLQLLEERHADMVTVASRKLVAGELVKLRR